MLTNKLNSRGLQVLLNLTMVLTILVGSAAFPAPVRADSTITVTTTADELNSDGDCSLREAIQAANSNAVVDACSAGSGADTITVPIGTYTLTIAGAGEEANATGDLDITGPLTINGAGAGTTIIRAGATPGTGIDRVFHVIGASTVGISDVTIANGVCTSCSGGGIFNAGTLSVTNSTFSGNSAVLGGGIFNNNGTLNVTNSTFSGNTAVSGYGGAISNSGGTLTVTNSTFSGNSANDYGGGIYNNGTLSVANSTFSGNSATFGGGIHNYSGTLTVTNSTFSGNSAVVQGGGIYNREVNTVTVTNSTFSGNTAGSLNGGGIYNNGSLHLKNTLLANSASGGDCYNESGDAIVTNTNNLIENNGPSGHKCGTPAVTADPGLGALANNGGSTKTFAIGIDSSPYNAGDNATCAAADQRGVARPQNGTCDIGAYESTVQFGPLFGVNTTEDSNDGSCDTFAAGVGDCTLREAVTAANLFPSADTITVPAGTYTLTIVGAGEDANATGDLDITDSVTINGASAGTTVIRAGATPGSGIDRVLHVAGAYTVNISGVTVRNGVGDSGGGINQQAGTLTITNSAFSGNSVSGIGNSGGGIFHNVGTLTITNSAFSGNSATGGSGGGIYINSGTAAITNSTFSGNSAFVGGGIFNSGTLTITNSTFSGNSANDYYSYGGGIYRHSAGGAVTLRNTIVANSASGGNCSGTIADGGNNLDSANTCGFTTNAKINTDPNLGALTGSPAYFPLNLGSPAIDAGSDAICEAAPVNNTSQNGLTRPQGAHCDIGSYELKIYTLFLPLILR